MISNKEKVVTWFTNLRDQVCTEFEKIELEYSKVQGLATARFIRTPWDRKNGGGGVMSVMRGNLFEKVGVNISTVFGKERYSSRYMPSSLYVLFSLSGL